MEQVLKAEVISVTARSAPAVAVSRLYPFAESVAYFFVTCRFAFACNTHQKMCDCFCSDYSWLNFISAFNLIVSKHLFKVMLANAWCLLSLKNAAYYLVCTKTFRYLTV
jgi:hypothetical protein